VSVVTKEKRLGEAVGQGLYSCEICRVSVSDLWGALDHPTTTTPIDRWVEPHMGSWDRKNQHREIQGPLKGRTTLVVWGFILCEPACKHWEGREARGQGEAGLKHQLEPRVAESIYGTLGLD
jgi:hypothetical protein